MPSLTATQHREMADAIEAYEAGKPVEVFKGGQWRKEMRSPPYWSDYPRRPAPEPVFGPWSFNTRPREVVWVYRKGYITDSMIAAWGDDCVSIVTKRGLEVVNYEKLFTDFLQRDGSPCGIQIQPVTFITEEA